MSNNKHLVRAFKGSTKVSPGTITSKSAVIGSNLRHTHFYHAAKEIVGDAALGLVNPDKGVVIDPFEHMETEQHLVKADSTSFILQAKSCITKEELSLLDFSKPSLPSLSTKSVVRVCWRPPLLLWNKSKSLVCDSRGVFADLGHFTVKFTNLLSQSVKVSFSSPRSKIQQPSVISYRDYTTVKNLSAGEAGCYTMHWGDSSNLKSPVVANFKERSQGSETIVNWFPCFVLLDLLVEYASIDRQSNTAYLPETEVVSVDISLTYSTGTNYPPDVTISPLEEPFLLSGSNKPAKDLFGMNPFRGSGPKCGLFNFMDIGDPKWLTLNEGRAMVGLVRDGPNTNHRLYLAAMDADYSSPTALQLGIWRTSKVRIFVPGLSVSKPVDPHPDTAHAWANYSLFGWSHSEKKWYLWDDHSDKPYEFGDISQFNSYNDRNLVPAGLQACFLTIDDIKFGGYAVVNPSDIIGVLSTVTEVLKMEGGSSPLM